MRFIAAFLLVCASAAQGFPIAGKPLRIVVPFPPGGQTDIQARVAIHVQLPHLHRAPPWDAFRDFTPVTTGARSATADALGRGDPHARRDARLVTL